MVKTRRLSEVTTECSKMFVIFLFRITLGLRKYYNLNFFSQKMRREKLYKTCEKKFLLTCSDDVFCTWNEHQIMLLYFTIFSIIKIFGRPFCLINISVWKNDNILIFFPKDAPSKALSQLGWKANYKAKDVIKMMLQAEMESIDQMRNLQARA